MIERIKKLYPEYLIFIKINNKIFDLSNKELKNKDILIRHSHIIIDDNSYEVHTKIKNRKSRLNK